MGRAGGGIEGTLVLFSVGLSRPGLTARSTVPEAARYSANEGAPTTLAYDVPEAGPVHLALHGVLGRAVAVLAVGPQAAGTHEVLFDAAGLPSGVYVARLETERGALTRRLTLVR